jgi:hypothetical protein
MKLTTGFCFALSIAIMAAAVTSAQSTVPAAPTNVRVVTEPPTSPTTSGSGFWLTRTEIQALPVSGPAWTKVLSAADASWPAPMLYDNSNRHDIYIVAGALVYARTGTASYRTKVRDGISQMMAVGYDDGTQSATGAGRNLAGYAVAADLIELKTVDATLDSKFRAFLKTVLDHQYPSGASPRNLRGLACGWGNGATMARATNLAASLYLGDRADVDRLAKCERRFQGDVTVTDVNPVYPRDTSFRSWQVSSSEGQWAGIQLLNAKKDGHLFDGIIPSDHRRDSSGGDSNVYTATTFPGTKQTSYPWVNLQGATVAVELLARNGYPQARDWMEKALLRAHLAYNVRLPQQYPGKGWSYYPTSGYLIPLVNYMYPGTNLSDPFGPQGPDRQGFILGWFHWTHGGRSR